MVWFFERPVYKYSYGPDQLTIGTIQNHQIWNGLKQSGDHLAWFKKRPGFQISDPFWNPDHLLTDIFSPIYNPETSRFQIPTVVDWLNQRDGTLKKHILNEG